MTLDPTTHWQRIYTDKAPDSVSWYQRSPIRSLSLIHAHKSAAPCHIIDIGAGASNLVDHLLDSPAFEPWLVDISTRALDITRARLADRAARAHFTTADITQPLAEPPVLWADLWHDRAVFHFLTDDKAIKAYARNLARILKPGGTAIIATFAPDGPAKCSGLDVRRHDAPSIHAALTPTVPLTLLSEAREDHATPSGAIQKFTYAILRRTPAP